MCYRTLSEHLKAQFGCKVYKLSLDAGMSCPNRDGVCGTRGCIFCDGSGSFAQKETGSIAEQLELAKQQVAAKASDAKYIAYFQSFTNTYAPVSVLEPLYTQAMAPEDIVAVSIATRPDCLPPEVLELLARLNRRKPVWVELGLQSIHPQTARYIRRGYPLHCFDQAVCALKSIGVTVIVHMILGLPGETEDMMVATARHIAASGADGIKLHLLHVLKNTDLAQAYLRGSFEVLTLGQYIHLLERCIAQLPPQMVIHRLTGDGAKRDLIAPLWSGDKKRVLNAIHRAFQQDGLVQGSDYVPSLRANGEIAGKIELKSGGA